MIKPHSYSVVVIVLLMPVVLSCSRREEAIHSYNRGITYANKSEHAKAEADFAKAKELGYEPE